MLFEIKIGVCKFNAAKVICNYQSFALEEDHPPPNQFQKHLPAKVKIEVFVTKKNVNFIKTECSTVETSMVVPNKQQKITKIMAMIDADIVWSINQILSAMH